MLRSGNPELDIAIEKFRDKIVKKLKSKQHKYGEECITRNGNKPHITCTFSELVNHLVEEMHEFQDMLDKGKFEEEEVIDVAAMCFLTIWCHDEILAQEEEF